MLEPKTIDDFLMKDKGDFSRNEGIEKYLGINNKEIRKFKRIIGDDLGKDGKIGIHWWDGEDAVKAIISDYLFSLPGSIEENLLNAFVHKSEVTFRDKKRREFFKNSIELLRDGYKLEHPDKAEHYVNEALINANLISFFRGISSALDCLAGLIIGICAFEKDIVEASFSGLLVEFAKKDRWNIENCPDFDQLKSMLEFKKLDWALYSSDLRNMYVHRSRRLSYEELRPKPLEPQILNQYRKPILKTDIFKHLPKAPHLTELEALGIYKNTDFHLRENYLVTMEGIWQDTVDLIQNCLPKLEAIWNYRKKNNLYCEQAEKQWGGGIRIKRRNKKGDWFKGYDPESSDKSSQATIPPEVAFRMSSGGISDQDGAIWKGFAERCLIE